MYSGATNLPRATLPLYVLSDYTASMKSRALLVAILSAIFGADVLSQQPPGEPREILASLNRVHADPAAVYKIESGSRIELRRGSAKLQFEDGTLALFAPVDGKITGAVYSGRGHILATSRDPVEKQQFGYFLGAPRLDKQFGTAYLRFTEDTFSELQHQLDSAQIKPQTDTAFANLWHAAILARAPAHSLRFLYDALSETPYPYFVASLGGLQTGPFDFIYDEAREESEMFGQAKRVNGADFYDIVNQEKDFTILNYNVKGRNRDWVQLLTRKTIKGVIFCNGLGDVISRESGCLSCRTVPEGQNYLTAVIQCLKHLHQNRRGSSRIEWKLDAACFREHTVCGAFQRHVQAIDRDDKEMIASVDDYPHGVVVFGEGKPNKKIGNDHEFGIGDLEIDELMMEAGFDDLIMAR